MADDIEAALRRSERHLAAAQRITQCGSWELDLADLDEIDRNPLRWSDEVFRIFGYEPGAIEVTNENFFNAVHPDDRDKIRSAFAIALERGTRYAIDHRVIRPDGSVRVVHEQSEIQYDDRGKPQLAIGTVQDVTEQRQTEARLASAERLIAVGALAAGVAHEINNPLVAVTASLELLSRALADAPPRVRDLLATASDGAERVGAIVRDLLIYSRSDDSPRGPVDVGRALDSALRMAGHELREHARVIVDRAEAPLVEANEARLAQVFLNLLRNAAQAIETAGGGGHEVHARCRTDARGWALVEIADTGCGIPPELRSQIFTPFFTTKPIGVGSGLGLSICQRLVSDLGGELAFDSEAGKGSVFRVALPPR
jgi:PAS domain S-box-containing protein